MSVARVGRFALDHDPIKLNLIMIWMLRWSMILSENRFPATIESDGKLSEICSKK